MLSFNFRCESFLYDFDVLHAIDYVSTSFSPSAGVLAVCLENRLVGTIKLEKGSRGSSVVLGLHLEAGVGLRIPIHWRSPHLHNPPGGLLQHPILLLRHSRIRSDPGADAYHRADVAEAASPDSVNSQPYLTLLVGVFCFARFVKKRD